MSVLSINERIDTGGGSESKDRRAHTRLFIIECSASTDNTSTIFNARSIGPDILPRANDSFPGDNAAKCTNVSIKRLSEKLWEATCSYEYSGDTITTESTEDEIDPWNLPPFNISVTSYGVNEAASKAYDTDDAQDNPTINILNSAGDQFNPPLSTVKRVAVIKFSYNLKTFSLNWPLEYIDTVNKESVCVLGVSIPAQTAMMQNLEGQRLSVKNSDGDVDYYWQINVEIAVSKTGFDHEVLNAGFHCIDGEGIYEIGICRDGGTDDGKMVPITSDYKNNKNVLPVTEPQLLNDDGELSTDGAHYLTFVLNYPKSWNSLCLPKNLDSV